MAKKIILALIILILIAVLAINFLGNSYVDIYTDGENVSVKTTTLAKVDKKNLNTEISNYTFKTMMDPNSNITTLKEGIKNICSRHGINDVKIKINSTIGENQIPILVHVKGTSMTPTLKDGQTVILNKTHNIKVGDIVVAKTDEYGGIIKRVDQINGTSVHLVSDNKNVSYERINGNLYLIKGITTWVDISNITGVAISY